MSTAAVRVWCCEGPAPAEAMARLHQVTASHAYAHLFSTPFPLDDARARWAAPHDQVWLASRAGELVGFATAIGDELDGLYVLPEESGRGVGSRLLDAVDGVRRLWVLEGNAVGRAWYERRGWRDGGARREEYGVQDVLYVR